MDSFSNGQSSRSRRIDLNADLGEGFPNDRTLLELVTSASICCGAHAGGREVIRQTLRDASACQVVVGAHPGYQDREGFGRREQKLSPDDVTALVRLQVDQLIELAGETNMRIAYIKPHGALYNQAQCEVDVAVPVVAAALHFRLPLFGQPGTLLEATACEQRVPFVREGFPDRRYSASGSLRPRSESGAVLGDPAEIESQVLRLVKLGQVASLCIHGDDPRAVANAQLVRTIAKEHGIVIRNFRDDLD